jgi:hypothetical protein
MLVGLFKRHWPEMVYQEEPWSWPFIAIDVFVNILLNVAHLL